MNDKTRYAKIVQIITEVLSTWMKDFLKSRIPPSLSVEDYIKQPQIKHLLNDNAFDQAVKKGELDVSALAKIIKTGKLVKGHRYEKEIQESIDDIIIVRNGFMHTTNARTGSEEYRAMIRKFKRLAEKFEKYNNKYDQEYQNQIEHIDIKTLDEEEENKTIKIFKDYIKIVESFHIPDDLNDEDCDVSVGTAVRASAVGTSATATIAAGTGLAVGAAAAPTIATGAGLIAGAPLVTTFTAMVAAVASAPVTVAVGGITAAASIGFFLSNLVIASGKKKKKDE